MKLKITLYSVCLLMLLAACQQDGPTPEPSVGSRTEANGAKEFWAIIYTNTVREPTLGSGVGPSC